MTRVICLKQGNKYGPEYVRILHNRVRAYLPTLEEFVCYTDTRDQFETHYGRDESGITIQDLPGDLPISGWWWKCWILGQEHPGENIFFDLDVLITGNLEGYRPKTADGLWGLWNTYHLNSSILGWHNSLPTVWDRFWRRRGTHLGMGGVHGDQEIINEAVAEGDFKQYWYPEDLTAWINVKQPALLARAWTGTQKTVICKGPRNPHEHPNHPLVQAYWRTL
jgi:hypothetical protein